MLTKLKIIIYNLKIYNNQPPNYRNIHVYKLYLSNSSLYMFVNLATLPTCIVLHTYTRLCISVVISIHRQKPSPMVSEFSYNVNVCSLPVNLYIDMYKSVCMQVLYMCICTSTWIYVCYTYTYTLYC